MKKIFRMQYEPCLGTCYAYDQELMKQLFLLQSQPDKFNDLLNNLNYIHDKSCGNLNLGFILDYDENMFIGTFLYDTQSQSFIGKDLNDVYNKFKILIDLYYGQNKTVKTFKDSCDYGRDDNIIEWTKEQINKYLFNENMI